MAYHPDLPRGNGSVDHWRLLAIVGAKTGGTPGEKCTSGKIKVKVIYSGDTLR
jgi:hypothetical protein